MVKVSEVKSIDIIDIWGQSKNYRKLRQDSLACWQLQYERFNFGYLLTCHYHYEWIFTFTDRYFDTQFSLAA